MEVVDKKSYTLYPLTSYTAGATKRNLYEKVPMTVKIDIDIPTPIDIPDQVMPLAHKINVYELDELPTDQELLFDTKDELIEKLEEWGFEWKDFAEKICFFPYNANETVATSNKFAKGWVKDTSPVWGAWDNLGIGKSWRAKAGPLYLSADDQYYGKVNELIPYPMQSFNSIRNIEIRQPIINRFAISNKPLEETKHIWVGEQLLKTDAENPGDEDTFTLYLNNSTIPDFGSARTGSGQGNTSAGYSTGITAELERGRAGFAIPILFYVNNPVFQPVIANVDKIYGLIYFGYVQRNYDGAVSEQKYFIMTHRWINNSDGWSYYYANNSGTASKINEATAKIDEFFDNAEEWKDEDIDLPETDPYETIQESENGGGDGTLNWTSDEINDDSTTILTPAITGEVGGVGTPLYNVYYLGVNPNVTLANLHNYMWSENFLEAITKANADVRQSIISLHALPYICTNGSSDEHITMCGKDTGVLATVGVPQKEEFNLGSIQVQKFYGSYLDYSPYTSVSIYLPFIGIRDLPTDQVMGKTINVKYTFNNYDGNCIARVFADGDLIDCYNGQCSLTYPLTGLDYSQKLSGEIMKIGGIAAMGAGLLSMGGALYAGAKIGLVATGAALSPGARMLGMGTLGAATGAINANKSNIYHSSSLGGSISWFSYRTPYLTIISPRIAQPRHRNGIAGKATCRTVKVSDISGFNQFSDIHVDQVVCSDTEKELIKKALTGGFIV